LDQGQIGFGVHADPAPLELAAVVKPDSDLGGGAGHVIVGQNVTVRADNHAGARPALRVRRLLLSLHGVERLARWRAQWRARWIVGWRVGWSIRLRVGRR